MAKEDSPRYKSRRDRIYHALRLYHGIGKDREWDRDEIADYLNVRRTTVDEYLDETEQSREIRRTFDKVADETRRELIMEKRDRLRQLRELEEELRDAVEVVVTDFTFEQTELEVQGHPGKGIGVSEDADATFDGEVPVPSRVKQVPQFDRLASVWEEMRQTEDELSDLMGLNAPEELQVEADVTDRKVYKLGDDEEAGEEAVKDGFPEQNVKDLSEEDSV